MHFVGFGSKPRGPRTAGLGCRPACGWLPLAASGL